MNESQNSFKSAKKPSYAVFRNAVSHDALLNSELNFGHLVNSLYGHLTWISAPQELSSQIDSASKNKGFNNFLNRVLSKFLLSDSDFVMILQDHVWLSEDFVPALKKIKLEVNDEIDILSLIPCERKAEEVDSIQEELLFPSAQVNKSGFVVTRHGALNILKSLQDNLCEDFERMINARNFRIYTTNGNFIKNIAYNLTILNAQDQYLGGIREEPKLRRLSFAPEFQESSSRSPSVDAIILHWDRKNLGVLEIEKACKSHGYRTLVLNSSDVDYSDGTWIHSPNISFFSNIELASNLFNSSADYLLLITGDVATNSWKEFFSESDAILKGGDVGTLSPALTANHFHLGRFPRTHEIKHADLFLVHHNDVVVIYIKKEIVVELRRFFEYFNKHYKTFLPMVGFGVGEVVTNLVFHSNLSNLRFMRHVVMHPYSRSYDNSIAFSEMKKILEIANDYFQDRFSCDIIEDHVKLFETRLANLGLKDPK